MTTLKEQVLRLRECFSVAQVKFLLHKKKIWLLSVISAETEHALHWQPSGHSVTPYAVLRVSRDPSWWSCHIKRVTHTSRTTSTRPGRTRLCCASWMLQHFSILSPAKLSGTEAR